MIFHGADQESIRTGGWVPMGYRHRTLASSLSLQTSSEPFPSPTYALEITTNIAGAFALK